MRLFSVVNIPSARPRPVLPARDLRARVRAAENYIPNHESKFMRAAIHPNCDAAEYNEQEEKYMCLDDDFAASDMAPLGFAYQVTRAATATYSGGDQDIFTDGGYFYYNPDTKSFFWNYDGSNEVEYDYDYNDQKNFPGAVKLWKKDGSNTGWYKVYNNCEDGIGQDGKVGCYLHFYCLDWNTDDLGSDC